MKKGVVFYYVKHYGQTSPGYGLFIPSGLLIGYHDPPGDKPPGHLSLIRVQENSQV